MEPLTEAITIPANLAHYHLAAMSVVRHYRRGPLGPEMPEHSATFSEVQEKFLSDVCHAFHNLLQPGGVEFFFDQAAKINAAWKPKQAELKIGNPWVRDLLPLPEKP